MSYSLHVTTQLTLLVAHKVGTFGSVCRMLSRAGIPIHAFSSDGNVDHAVIRLVVDRPAEAIRILETHGALVLEDDVLMIEGTNRTGLVVDICEKLTAARVNIEYTYSATPPKAGNALIILRPDHIGKALKALNGKKESTAPRKKAKKF